MLNTESGRRTVSGGRLYRVCWKSSVTQVHGRSAPMSRDQAEFMAHDEAIGTASCRFWIEPLAEAEDEDAETQPTAGAVHAAGARHGRHDRRSAHRAGS